MPHVRQRCVLGRSWIGVDRRDVRSLFFLVKITTARLNQLAAISDAREIEANIGTMLPLAEAATAHEILDAMHSRPRGKIVLRHDT